MDVLLLIKSLAAELQQVSSTYSTELLNFVDVVLQGLWLSPLMKPVEFGNVVDLSIILHTFRNPLSRKSLPRSPTPMVSNTYSLNPAGLYPLYSPFRKSSRL
jgi:hypothetical protein